jgi:hypothetical protein
MGKNVTLSSIAILSTLALIAACEPTGLDDDPAVRPAYDDQESADQSVPDRIPDDQDPQRDEPATEEPPAADESDE